MVPNSCLQSVELGYSFHKKISKRNLAHVGMAQCMNALVDKVQKQEVPAHSDMHSMTCMATLFNDHPYISSSNN